MYACLVRILMIRIPSARILNSRSGDSYEVLVESLRGANRRIPRRVTGEKPPDKSPAVKS